MHVCTRTHPLAHAHAGSDPGVGEDLNAALKAAAYSVHPNDPGSNPAMRGLAWVLIIFKPLLFTWMLLFILGMLSWPYAELRIGAR